MQKSKKKILIYDKWLKTVGGGEKVATVAAEALKKEGFKVDILTNYSVNKKYVEDKMGVDLSGVEIKVVYDRSYAKLNEYTKYYDLLINTSYLDSLPSSAKRSLYYVHFPTPVKNTLFGFIKYEKILPFLRKFLIIPYIEAGLDIPDEIIIRSGKWMGKINKLIIHNSPKRYSLNLRFYAESLSTDMLDGINIISKDSKLIVIDNYIDPKTNILVYKLEVESHQKKSDIIEVSLSDDVYRNGVGLVSLTVFDIRYLLWNLMKRYMARYEMALYGSSDFKPGLGLGTYDRFLSNSKFTKKWVKKYWSKESEVLYPPVDINEFKQGKKENKILSVGRFFKLGHSKRQDIMVQAFKKGVDSGMIPKSWELHLVGGLGTAQEDIDYYDDISNSIGKYKIYLHKGIDFKELKKLYSKCKIYWHAAGFGIDGNRSPIEMEHFGITPVEAMAAGCVPVVFRGGGLTETVKHEEVGYTWKTEDELIKYTKKLINSPKLMNKMSKLAEKRAKKYSRNKFTKKLLKIVKEMI